MSIPNAKSIFCSKIFFEKFEFSSENLDLGVFDVGDFKFLGPESKFERNWTNRFSNFQNQFSGQKIQNRIRISGFEMPIFEFWVRF